MGAPLPGAPPCILQRRFPRTARDRHGFPLRVRAPHRGAWFMGNFFLCISLFPPFLRSLSPLVDGTYDRLPALVDMDVLHCDLLLALAAMPIERIEQGGIGTGELV